MFCRGGELASIFAQLPHNAVILVLDNLATIQSVGPANLTWNQSMPVPVTRMSLTESSLQEVEGSAFEAFTTLQDLDLSQNKLHIIDALAFLGLSSLRTLNLSRNRISDIGMLLKPLVSLQQLDLSYNAIMELQPDTFSSQTSLSYLRLDGNQLLSLEGMPLQPLTFLTHLSCRACSLSSVKYDLFAAIPRVNNLDLGENRLTQLPSFVQLSDMKYLKYLFLDNNSITTLLDSQFADLTLTFLGLSGNLISEIPSKAFEGLSLEQLDLSQNRLAKVTNSLFFVGPKGLMSLNLAHNPIQEFEPLGFQGLHSLETLNLSSCSLTTLNPGLLHELHNLRKLDISWNNLQSVSEDDIAIFDRLVIVNLSKNNWNCDCSIKSLRDWLRGKRSLYKLYCAPGRRTKDCAEPLCSTPESFSEQPISLLEDSEIQECTVLSAPTAPLPTAAQAGIVVACLFFSLGMLVLTVYLWRRGHTRKKLVRVISKRRSRKTNESRLDDEENEKISPFQDCDNKSLKESHRSFVFNHYFEKMVTDPKLLSRTSSSQPPSEGQAQEDSMYSSNPSLYDRSHNIVVAIESTV